MQPAPATPPTPDLISADEYERPLAAAAEAAVPAVARAVRLIAAQITAVAYDSRVSRGRREGCWTTEQATGISREEGQG